MKARIIEKDLLPVLVILLVPLILICHQFNYFKSLLLYRSAYLLFGLYLAVPVIFYFLAKKFLKLTITVAALLTINLAVFFFFFGVIQDALLSHPATAIISKTYVLTPLLLLPAFILLLKKPELKTTFNFIAVALTAFLVTDIFKLLFLSDFSKDNISIVQPPKLNATTGIEKDSLSIYHLVFDGYTNSKTLSKQFEFSNPLDSFLTSQGFYVAQNSKSNYNFTPFSIGSTLHLNYLNVSESQLERSYKNYLLGTRLYTNNEIFLFFQERGYAVSSFSILKDYQYLDKLGTFVPKTPVFSIRNQTLERIFLNPWLWEKLKGSKAKLPKAVQNSLKNYKIYNEEALANVRPADTKTYNFTHFLLPHEPYVYSRASIDSLSEADLMGHKQGYVKQIKYANSLIEKLVIELRKNPKNIIIIQGDHGFREYAETENPHTQLETFNAVYFPDRQYQLLYDTFSLVNTYRVILGQYFQQPVSLLKDQYFLPKK